MKNLIIFCCLSLLLFGCNNPDINRHQANFSNSEGHGAIILLSDNEQLVQGFRWAKEQALSYVFEGDPVGNQVFVRP